MRCGNTQEHHPHTAAAMHLADLGAPPHRTARAATRVGSERFASRDAATARLPAELLAPPEKAAADGHDTQAW
ncbi:hypothetical protein Scel_83940 [Streptomyces cellostaticus]|nr:hypothetical protein Scel_83940 [Streptomyces cellostaticus]